MNMNEKIARELTTLFFMTRQLMRAKLPSGAADPNAWLRFETLRYIAQLQEPMMQDVAKHLRIRAPSATSLIRNLVRDGLVARRGLSSDKRVVRIRLTKQGALALSVYGKRSTSTMRKVFIRSSPAEIRTLMDILRSLQDIHRA